MNFVDTHCHIHFPDYELDPEEVVTEAKDAGVTDLICVGCTLIDSKLGIDFAQKHTNIWASIGIHPHESSQYVDNTLKLQKFRNLASHDKVVAIGETGLDYYYEYSSKKDQKQMLRFQIDLAVQNKLPLIFHVRDAFEDFWTIFDEYKGLKGVIHSFSSDLHNLNEILSRGLYVGLNGISTFTKQADQLEAIKAIPLGSMILETDAPYLTPVPFRGTICQPKHVVETAKFLCKLRGEPLEKLAITTTDNAKELFKIT